MPSQRKLEELRSSFLAQKGIAEKELFDVGYIRANNLETCFEALSRKQNDGELKLSIKSKENMTIKNKDESIII